jgi:UDP-N-acetylglucosamine--N-acetylmuramyl-(pentapeptide) pyrophosphoryl-undecaprenol N-acetylglucosamine transferase
MARSGTQSRRRLREFCPDVVVGLGGFGSYAPVRVGQKYGAATAVLNPDIVPGRANRRLARRADRIFCQFQETVDALGGSARLTGCPVRPSILGGKRSDGIAAFGLDPGRRTLLVTGASSGARTVNRAVVAMLKSRGLPDGWQVLHLTGHGEFSEVSAAYREMKVAAVVRAYADQMGLAYAAADLAVARAGASTVAELLSVGLPTVFMPYPFHRDQHQMLHARAVERLGAAAVVEDRPVAAATRALADVLSTLMSNPAELSRMAEKSRAAGRPRAAHEIAREILALADRVTEDRHAAILGGMHAGRSAGMHVDNIPTSVYTRTGEEKP